MGGTFDHMHSGHKLLLTQACLLTKDTLHIGITGDELLKSKAYAALIEPFELRKQRVLRFIQSLTVHLKIEITELSDPVGPAGTNPNFEACILTREVEKGGTMINEIRLANQLQPLELVFVDMILAQKDLETQNYSNKLSSTYIRKYLASETNN